MKKNSFVCFLILMLGIAAGQTVSPTGTNSTATNMTRGLTDAEIGFVPDATNNVPQFQGFHAPENDVHTIFEETKTNAEKGDAISEFNLGILFHKGNGVPVDEAEAVKWWMKAAEQGNITAQSLVGFACEHGKGIAQDYVEAFKWYKRAAQQGDLSSQSALGVLYMDGKGVPKNNIEAYKWLNLVVAQGAKDEFEKNIIKFCATMRDLMVNMGNITPYEITEAQRLSASFVLRKETPDSKPNSDSNVISGSPTVTGTGFFITDDGYLISNYHVIKDAAKVRLRTGVGLLEASVVKVDAVNDLALIKADIVPAPPPGFILDKGEPTKFVALPIAASRTVKLGATVATVGFPDTGLQGFSPKLAKGEIGSLAGIQDDPRYFQISVPVQPGNSGGALVDAHGNVVGIVAAKLDASAALAATGALPENVNYAVKSSLLLSFLESVPDVDAKLKEPNTKDEAFEDVVKSAQDAAVLVLVY
jgi:S1-C subfamily serine protease